MPNVLGAVDAPVNHRVPPVQAFRQFIRPPSSPVPPCRLLIPPAGKRLPGAYSGKKPAASGNAKAKGQKYNYDAKRAPIFRGVASGRVGKPSTVDRITEEVHHYRMTTGFLIPRKHFTELVKSTMETVLGVHDLDSPKKASCIQASALALIQTAYEDFAAVLFEALNVVAHSSGRVTVGNSDIVAAFKITRMLAPYISTIKDHRHGPGCQ